MRFHTALAVLFLFSTWLWVSCKLTDREEERTDGEQAILQNQPSMFIHHGSSVCRQA